MTIIHIITSSVNWGGMEQYALDMAMGAISKGDRVIFVARNDSDVVPSRLREYGFEPYLLPLNSKFDFKSIKELRKIVIDNGVDVIHTHQPKNIFHARLAVKDLNVRIVHTIHFVLGKASPHWLYRRIFDMADVLIAVSNVVRDRVLELYDNLDHRKVVTIYNSIDPKRVAGMTEADNELVVIGYAGRIVRDKGVFIFVDAVGVLIERGVKFRVVIAGTGSCVEQLKGAIVDMVQVQYVGFESNIAHFIEQIDIAVVPSIVREAFSLMVVEYMASGRALVASNVGGHIEVIDDGVNGVLFESGDAVDLADKLQLLIENRDNRVVIGRAAKRSYDERLNFKNFIEATISTYIR